MWAWETHESKVKLSVSFMGKMYQKPGGVSPATQKVIHNSSSQREGLSPTACLHISTINIA